MRGFDVGDFYAALTNQFLLVGVLVTAGLTVAGLAGGLILGLAIALGVARAHGGTIELVSEPGQGAEFVMTLPVASAERERDENV